MTDIEIARSIKKEDIREIGKKLDLTEDDLILYGNERGSNNHNSRWEWDGEKYDYKTLPMVARLKDDDYKVVKAIVDLYLRKMIVFETC